MSRSFCMLQWLSHPRGALLLYAATWTTILTLTVVLASFVPEIAFYSAMVAPSSSSSSSLSDACSGAGSVRLPLDIPSENLCFPSRLLDRSGFDIVVPPVFAAVIVAGSACFVKAMGLWEVEDDEQF